MYTDSMRKLHTDIKIVNSPIFQILYSWESPDRQWREKDKLWYASYSLFFVLVIAVSVILGYYLLIVATIAFSFLWFVQATIPPEKIDHKITSTGIKTFGKSLRWREIKYFWFSKKDINTLLHIDYINESNPDFIKRITIICDDRDSDIFNVLVKFCDYGDKEETGYNFFSNLVYGKHIDELNYAQAPEGEIMIIEPV